VTWSRGIRALPARRWTARTAGVGVELIDLRTLWPWDRDAVLGRSAARTGRLLVVHEAVQAAGFGAEVAAAAAEATGCRVARLGAPRIPVGYAQVLENESRLTAPKVAQCCATAARRALTAVPGSAPDLLTTTLRRTDA
jgi:pyruvate/2-oxoglutarate/acetoin dehydrogenase E1 component